MRRARRYVCRSFAAACTAALLSAAQPALVDAQAHHHGMHSRGSTMRSRSFAGTHRATGTTSLGSAGPAPVGAAGPPPLGAAGPPPLGAAGPPPIGAAGPPPVNRGVIVSDPVRCQPGADCGFDDGDPRAGTPADEEMFEE